MIDPAIIGEYEKDKDAIPLRLDQLISIPTLNLFLGSTPGFAALEAMRRVANLPGVERGRVAFVHIDIDSPPAEVQAFRDDPNNKGKLTSIDLRINVANGALYADSLPPDRVQHSYIPRKVPQSWDAGAGGIRNNGHVAACTYHTQIRQAIDGALASLRELPPTAGAAPVRDIHINVVAFLGGGTGSGILPDIIVMAREQVNKLNLPHRLNVFCLLPEQFGQTTANDEAWRRSNATATLLEIIGLSLAKDGLYSNGSYAPASERMGPQSANAPVYMKYMFNEPYPISGTTIAHEVYLYGNTSVKNAVDAARIIGIDLYSRMVNGSGVGYLERSKAVDRRTLDSRDGGGVPTMFGTSCPLEVMFPGPETALAFALLTSADVLPHLAGNLNASSATSRLTIKEQADVVEWRDAMAPEPMPPRFQDAQFTKANQTKIMRMRAILERYISNARTSVEEKAQALEQREYGKIRSAKTRRLSERITDLEALKRVYDASLTSLQLAGRPPKATEVEIEAAFRKLRQTLPVQRWQERAESDLCAAFNRTMLRAIEYTRWEKRVKLLTDLIDETNRELAHNQEAFKDIIDTKIIEDTRARAYASAAWNGRLDEPHIHTRHLFDLPRLQRMKPVERLYASMRHGIDLDRLTDAFMKWMSQRYSDELDLVGMRAADLRFRLVEYLRDVVFLPRLRQMNLLDLLEECCMETAHRAAANETVEALLYEHLNNMRLLTRPLVTVEPQLAANSQEVPSTTLFLGLHFHNGAQRALIERAYERLGQFDSQGLKPTLAVSFDPHLMQLVYGMHAFSIGTAPDYYAESNSSMSAMLQCQAAWYGDGSGTYGMNQAPVFSSGEMERLIMDPTALGETRDLPHRIIRPPQGFAGTNPTWGGGRPPSGISPSGGQPTYSSTPSAWQQPNTGSLPYSGQPRYER